MQPRLANCRKLFTNADEDNPFESSQKSPPTFFRKFRGVKNNPDQGNAANCLQKVFVIKTLGITKKSSHTLKVNREEKYNLVQKDSLK